MAEEIRLWTMQDYRGWQKARENGYVKADGRRIMEKFFRPSYRWLMGQMAERIPGYKSDTYPIWCYVQKPDMRQRHHIPKGSLEVRLEFIAPRDQVLVSDFSAWHDPLNHFPFTLDEAEFDSFMDRHDQAVKNDDQEALSALDNEVRATWPRIFDLNLIRQHEDWCGSADFLQATVGQISLDQIVKVEYFIGR